MTTEERRLLEMLSTAPTGALNFTFQLRASHSKSLSGRHVRKQKSPLPVTSA